MRVQRQAVVHTIDNEIIALNTQLKSLRDSEAQTMSRIASNPTQAKNLLSTERQQKVKESLYLFLLQKREENELSQAFTAYNTRIVNKPGASGIPPSVCLTTIVSLAVMARVFHVLRYFPEERHGKMLYILASAHLGIACLFEERYFKSDCERRLMRLSVLPACRLHAPKSYGTS